MLEIPNTSTVSVSMFRILEAYANSRKVDFSAISKAVGFEADTLDDAEARMPAADFLAVWKLVIAEIKDEYPGLQYGKFMARHYPGGNILFTMMMNCATVGRAMDVFIRYHRIMANSIQPILSNDGDAIHLSWNLLEPDFSPHPYISETLLCTFHAILERLSNGQLKPLEVRFTHSSQDDIVGYQDFFGMPVRFEAESNELLLHPDSFNIPIRLANRELFDVLELYAQKLVDGIGNQKNWTSLAIRKISEMFSKGITPKVDAIAKSFGLSRRGLQEKLKSENMTYRNCMDMVRQQIASNYLKKKDVTICDITFLLGYSEQSAFNHAFKRWTGTTPKEYRKALGASL